MDRENGACATAFLRPSVLILKYILLTNVKALCVHLKLIRYSSQLYLKKIFFNMYSSRCARTVTLASLANKEACLLPQHLAYLTAVSKPGFSDCDTMLW